MSSLIACSGLHKYDIIISDDAQRALNLNNTPFLFLRVVVC